MLLFSFLSLLVSSSSSFETSFPIKLLAITAKLSPAVLNNELAPSILFLNNEVAPVIAEPIYVLSPSSFFCSSLSIAISCISFNLLTVSDCF